MSIRRLIAVAVAVSGVAMPAVASRAAAASYEPGVVLIGYDPGAAESHALAQSLGVTHRALTELSATPTHEAELRLPAGESVPAALEALRATPGVRYAEPDYIARVADARAPQWIPDDPGRTDTPGGWQATQWNFLPDIGVDAPRAWANLRADRRPGGRGVLVAVLDTGVAYRDWHQFRRSPDFRGTRFVDPYDFVSGNSYPLDRYGHGTFVAGTIAESTNDGFGLTGIAYGATLMPVRVLDRNGEGDAATIAKGIRYAVAHGAQVINLSLEFDPSVGAREIPTLLSAIAYAHRHGAVVVAASGNDGGDQVAYPARARDVISVGATTRDRCLAFYSDGGQRLDLVAPGGGQDASLNDDPNCHPNRHLPDIFQMTFGNPAHPDQFGYPSGWLGTSMAAAHVSAVAALLIASGVAGRRPAPDQVLARLEATAQPLGQGHPNRSYGYGLIDAGAATAPG